MFISVHLFLTSKGGYDFFLCLLGFSAPPPNPSQTLFLVPNPWIRSVASPLSLLLSWLHAPVSPRHGSLINLEHFSPAMAPNVELPLSLPRCPPFLLNATQLPPMRFGNSIPFPACPFCRRVNRLISEGRNVPILLLLPLFLYRFPFLPLVLTFVSFASFPLIYRYDTFEHSRDL